MEIDTWRQTHGDTDTWRHMQTKTHGDIDTWRHRHKETQTLLQFAIYNITQQPFYLFLEFLLKFHQSQNWILVSFHQLS